MRKLNNQHTENQLGRDDKARSSLQRLRGNTGHMVDEELQQIQKAILIEKHLSKTVAWTEIWRGTDLRRTFLTMACTTFHAASGINFLVGYGTFFFQQAGVGNPFLSTVITQAVGVAAALLSLHLAGKYGRRTILLTGFIFTTITMFGVAILYTAAPHSKGAGVALVTLLAIYFGAYGGTIGPLSWVTAGEMSSNRLRSLTFGAGMAVGFIFAWLTTFTTPYFINPTALNWGAKVAWIWAPSNLVTLLFIYFVLPETKGRSLEEIDLLFLRRLNAREFKACNLSALEGYALSTDSEGMKAGNELQGGMLTEAGQDHKPLDRETEV